MASLTSSCRSRSTVATRIWCDREGHLAARRIGDLRRHAFRSSPIMLFVKLGIFPDDENLRVGGYRCEVGESSANPLRRFVPDRSGVRLQCGGKPRAPRRGGARRKSLERETAQRKTRQERDARGGGGARQNVDRYAGETRRRDEIASGIRNPRHPGIGGNGDDPGARSFENSRRHARGVLFAIAPKFSDFDLQRPQQPARDARIFGDDDLRLAQNVDRSQRDVSQVPQWCRYEDQRHGIAVRRRAPSSGREAGALYFSELSVLQERHGLLRFTGNLIRALRRPKRSQSARANVGL
jgi:hypothetical protein